MKTSATKNSATAPGRARLAYVKTRIAELKEELKKLHAEKVALTEKLKATPSA